jgi:hypothetical protein
MAAQPRSRCSSHAGASPEAGPAEAAKLKRLQHENDALYDALLSRQQQQEQQQQHQQQQEQQQQVSNRQQEQQHDQVQQHDQEQPQRRQWRGDVGGGAPLAKVAARRAAPADPAAAFASMRQKAQQLLQQPPASFSPVRVVLGENCRH